MSVDWGSVPDWIAVGMVACGTGVAVYKRKTIQTWWLGLWSDAEKAEKAVSDDELKVIREQVVRVAHEAAIILNVTSRGVSPVIVENTLGETHYFYRDFTAYKDGMRRSPATAPFSHHGTPSRPVSRWTRDECEQWLEENAT